MQELNNIEVLNSLKNSIKIVPGSFYENNLVATVLISPRFIIDFIDDINGIKYLRINEVLWKIKNNKKINSSDSSFPDLLGCFYEFTLVRCID